MSHTRACTARRPGRLFPMVACVLLASQCKPATTQEDGPPAPSTTGDGTVVTGGVSRSYTVDADQTQLLILVQTVDAAGCRLFHNHAVASTVTSYDFAFDRDHPANSHMTATVFAKALEPDRTADRLQFPQTEGQPFTEQDRNDVRVSVRNHVGAEQFATLTFTAHDFTTLDGAGTAPVDVSIKGGTSTVTMAATATWNGDVVTIEGTSVLDGTHHTIPDPGQTAAQCVSPLMPMKMKLVLKPGTVRTENTFDAGTTATRTFFPDDGGVTCGTVGFDQVRDTLVQRCAGCHDTVPRYGASVPLRTWQDFRFDTARSPGIPLYLQVAERVQIQDGGIRQMPPAADGVPVPSCANGARDPCSPVEATSELARLVAWAQAGGHESTCGQDAGSPTQHHFDTHDAGVCGTYGYEDVAAVLRRNSCVGCHYSDPGAGGMVLLPPLDSFQSGFSPPLHPFYAGLTLWEESLARMMDGTMPPGTAYANAPAADIALMSTWIAEQAPQARCQLPDGGTGPQVMVQGFMPASGVVGTPVTITGSGFSVNPQEDLVLFNSVAASVAVASAQSLTVPVPAGATTGPIQVTVLGTTVVAPGVFTVITPNPMPVVSSIQPTVLLAGSAQALLTVTGSGFVAASTVTLDDLPLDTTFVDGATLDAVLPATLLATPGAHTVAVTSPEPGGGTSVGVGLAVENPVPSITSAAPATLTAASSGQSTTLTGSGFVAGSVVLINGGAEPAQVLGPTTITVALRDALVAVAGTLSLVVRNAAPGGGDSAPLVLPVQNPQPVVTLLAPAMAAAGSASLMMTVTGSGFLPVSQVQWDGAALATSFVDSGHLTASLDAASLAVGGQHAVTVVNPQAAPSAPQTFTVDNPTPVVTGISPSTVPTGGAPFVLQVNGTGFNASSQVRMDGTALATSLVSATALTAPVGTINAPGTHTISVQNPAPGGGSSGNQTLTVSASTGPVITGVTPASAPAGMTFTLTVTGGGFVCGGTKSTLLFNGATLTLTTCSSTSLVAQVPAQVAGSYNVQVRNPAPSNALSNTVAVTVAAANPVPAITSLSPSSAAVGGGAFTLTVSGSGFVQGSTVQFNGASRTTSHLGSTSLTASIPATDLAAGGTFPVTVLSPAPGGGTSNTVMFQVSAQNPVPAINGLSPATAATGVGALDVTINGSGFGAGSTATFNAQSRPVMLLGSMQLVISLAAQDTQAAGTFPVVVTNPAPGGGSSNAYSFTVVAQNPVPTVGSLSPASVGAGSGAVSVVVGGTGFIPGSVASFNGVMKSTTYTSSTQLSVALSAGDTSTAGSYPVVITNPAPGGGASAPMAFVVGNPSVVLTSLSPSSVMVGNAATVTLNGLGMTAGTQAFVDGAARTTRFITASQVGMDLQAGDVASSGSRTITASNPGTPASNGLTLTVAASANPAPVVASLSPCGLVAGSGGFTLTITGSGFVAGAGVTFNGMALTPTSVGSAQVVVAVPAGAVATAPVGNAAAVVVTNPAPGGGASNSVTFGVASQARTLSYLQTNILSPSCATTGGCHVTGGAAPGDFSAGHAYAQLVGTPSTGCATKMRVLACGPLRPQSFLVDKVLATSADGPCFGNPMPKGAPLNAAQKQAIVDWVAVGAPNN